MPACAHIFITSGSAILMQTVFDVEESGTSGDDAMTAVNRTEENSVNINMRVDRRHRDLIDRAAQISGKTRTEFMLETACRAAEDAILDQRVFFADAEQYQRFSEALDAPAQSHEMLKTLLSRKAPWDK
jgi:uncharacterized protein (DUF1778 family)